MSFSSDIVRHSQVPIDCGATMCTKPAENIIKHTGNDTQAMYWAIGFTAKSLYNHSLPGNN